MSFRAEPGNRVAKGASDRPPLEVEGLPGLAVGHLAHHRPLLSPGRAAKRARSRVIERLWAELEPADAATLLATGTALVAIHDWAFLLGPGLIPAVNALFLGWVLHRTELVPRIIPTIGLAGAPLLVASVTATMFGLWDQVSAYSAIAALPIALWELSLGIWLVTKGFRPRAIVELDTVTDDPIEVGAQPAT